MIEKNVSDAKNNRQADLPGEGGCNVSSGSAEHGDADLASIMRAQREEKGLSLEECGQALRLPVRLLRQLEAGDYTGIDYHVYLRGYLLKYGHYLAVPDAAIEAELQRLTPRQPPLVSTGGVSRSRYLLERYAQAASYIVLTVVILVPVVWFGVRGGLQKGTSLLPLDSAPVAMRDSHDAAGAHRGSHQSTASTSNHDSGNRDPKPLLASIAPFAAMRADGGLAATPTPAAATTTVPTSTSPSVQTPTAAVDGGLSIDLDDASWVEITDGKGRRLEYALLPAGTRKTYAGSDAQTLNVRIGNADAATISVAGKKVDLAPYQHANVAHFDVNTRNGRTTDAYN